MTTVSLDVLSAAVAAAVEATTAKHGSLFWLHRHIQFEVAERIGLDAEYVRSVAVTTVDHNMAVVTWQCRAELSVAGMDRLVAAAT